jgi:tetratricopeptide (TPR) repeat protein
MLRFKCCVYRLNVVRDSFEHLRALTDALYKAGKPPVPGLDKQYHMFARFHFEHFEESDNEDELMEAISLGEFALQLRHPGHPHRDSTLHSLAEYYHERYQGAVPDMTALDRARILLEEAHTLRPQGHKRHFATTLLYGQVLSDVYTRKEDPGLFDLIRGLLETAIEPQAQTSLPRHRGLMVLCNLWHLRWQRDSDLSALMQTISTGRQALIALPLRANDERANTLREVANHLITGAEETKNVGLMQEAAQMYKKALEIQEAGGEDFVATLQDVGRALESFHEIANDEETLKGALDFFDHHIDSMSALNKRYSLVLLQYACVLLELEISGEDGPHQQRGLGILRKGLDAAKPNLITKSLIEDYGLALLNVCLPLSLISEQAALFARVMELNELFLSIHPVSNPGRARVLAGMAEAYKHTYERDGDAVSCQKLCQLSEEALDLLSPNSVLAVSCRCGLAQGLMRVGSNLDLILLGSSHLLQAIRTPAVAASHRLLTGQVPLEQLYLRSSELKDSRLQAALL